MTKILMTVLGMMTATIAIGSSVACGSSARLLERDAHGGRVQLEGAYMPAVADARRLMIEHCNGGGYRATQVGDVLEFRCDRDAETPAAGAELALQTR
jgi:hypothetical protein